MIFYCIFKFRICKSYKYKEVLQVWISIVLGVNDLPPSQQNN